MVQTMGTFRKLFVVLSFCVCLICINLVLLLPRYFNDPKTHTIFTNTLKLFNQNLTTRAPPKKIYFLEEISTTNFTDFLVNTSGCKIPYIDILDPSILRFVLTPKSQKCWKTQFHWTYTENDAIVINGSDIAAQGYSVKSIYCCYRIIKRDEQKSDKYNRNADNLISYSPECFPMDNVTKPKSGEYFMVSCVNNSKSNETLYEQFHTIPNIVKANLTKALYWNKYLQNEEKEIPPNIIFVGFDSNSRLNVQRNMISTVAVLEELGAVEMLGYTKGGLNTFPNFCQIFNGYSENDIKNICWPNSSVKHDDCPFIWKRLDNANYFTAHIEDWPRFTGFNYLKTGFVHQPVDFYPRALFIAAHNKTRNMKCIGYKTNNEIIVEYILSLINLAEKHKVPLFSFSWSAILSHMGVNSCQLIDDLYANLIRKIMKINDNTIFILLSDHGVRYGKYRETLSGWYEEKLPALWIYLPEKIRRRFPDWQRALTVNSKRLSSPYHLYWTINKILDAFTNTSTLPDEKDRKTGKLIPKQFKFSFFDLLSENWNCEDVGVPEIYCACYPLKKVDSKEYLLMAASKTIEHLNNLLPEGKCAKLTVKSVVGGVMIDKTSHKTSRRITYIVSFKSNPGDFLFEADVEYFPHNNSFSLPSNVLRTSQFNTNVSCVEDRNLQEFCYCL